MNAPTQLGCPHCQRAPSARAWHFICFVTCFKNRGNHHPNPMCVSSLFLPRKEASKMQRQSSAAVGIKCIYYFCLLKFQAVKSWTKHLTRLFKVTCHRLKTFLRDSRLLNFAAIQETPKSILPFIWIFEFALLLFLLSSCNGRPRVHLSSMWDTYP